MQPLGFLECAPGPWHVGFAIANQLPEKCSGASPHSWFDCKRSVWLQMVRSLVLTVTALLSPRILQFSSSGPAKLLAQTRGNLDKRARVCSSTLPSRHALPSSPPPPPTSLPIQPTPPFCLRLLSEGFFIVYFGMRFNGVMFGAAAVGLAGRGCAAFCPSGVGTAGLRSPRAAGGGSVGRVMSAPCGIVCGRVRLSFFLCFFWTRRVFVVSLPLCLNLAGFLFFDVFYRR